MAKKKEKKWIQKSVSRMKRKGTVGALRKQAGVGKNKKIPVEKLREMARSKNEKTRKRAQWALNMRKNKRKGKGKTRAKR